MPTPDLSPYARQEQSVRSDFAQRSAQNTFQRSRSNRSGQQGIADFRQGFQRDQPRFTAGFGQRGLTGPGVSSGTFQRAMQNRVGDYTRDMGRMQQDQTDNLQQFDFNQARFTQERDLQLSNIAAEKAALIANTAQQIAALRPFMG